MRTWSGPVDGDRRGWRTARGALWCFPLLLLAVLVGHPAAATASGGDGCSNAAFRTGPSANLPDCRAFELVSPPDKGPVAFAWDFIGNEVRFQPSRDGQHTVYPLSMGLPDASAGGAVRYRADRSASGWASTQLTPPALIPPPQPGVAQTGSYLYYAPDLSCGVLTSIEPLAADAPRAMVDAGNSNLFRRNTDGSYTTFTNTALVAIAGKSSLLIIEIPQS